MKRPFLRIISSALLLTCAVHAQTLIATLPSGNGPYAVAVNPVTNKIYIANYVGNSVTILDGSNHSSSTVNAGTAPSSIAVNPVTNKIYVANFIGSTMTVIDGTTNATSTVAVGTGASSVAVNPVTNRVYVANSISGTVTMFNGSTNATSTVAAIASPTAVAVNPVTNRIYVAGDGPGDLTVIDGVTNDVTTVTGVGRSRSLVVDPGLNRIYVAASNPNGVTVVDGVTHAKNFTPVTQVPNALALNPLTNRIYVGGASTVTMIESRTNTVTSVNAANGASSLAVNAVANRIYAGGANGFTAIDGVTNATVSVSSPSGIQGLAVNPLTNRVYGFSTNGNTVAVVDGASNEVSTIAEGAVSNPGSIAVNPVTNRIYTANPQDDTVTVVDGVTGAVTATVPVGRFPRSLAVNPSTNRIYVAHSGDGTATGGGVTEIDGATNAATLIPGTGGGPVAVAVNAATNRIYAANSIGNQIVAIDGATGAVRKFAAGSAPNSVAVNPVANKIYVTNLDSGNVTVLDGLSNAVRNVPTGPAPTAVAVNPVTNKAYVANGGRSQGGSVTVIDGKTNAAVNIAVAADPYSVAVNPLTNKIYVGKYSTGEVSVIDGVTNNVTTAMAQSGGFSIAVNPVTNKIYVPNHGAGSVTVIDGLSNRTSTVTVGTSPVPVAVNPVTNRIYIGNDTALSVIAGHRASQNPPLTNITGNQAEKGVRRNFTFTASAAQGGFAPNAVYFQLDTWQSVWTPATRNGPSSFQAAIGGLTPGFHILYAYAADGREATSIQPPSPVLGAIQAYGFLVTPVFLGIDADTQGSWNDQHGGDGYTIANGSSRDPEYAVYSVSGDIRYTWAVQSEDQRALRNGEALGVSRIASAFTQNPGQPFQINVNFVDGKTHQFGLYLLDWDDAKRVQTITVRDASTNDLIDEQTFSNFRDGVYAVWNLQGNVRLTVTPTANTSAAVSGIFFGSAVPPPVRGDDSPNDAKYAGLDTETHGEWGGRYGALGYRIANGGGSDPVHATVDVTGGIVYTWAQETTDSRALRTAPDAEIGIASAYTDFAGGQFRIDVNVNDGGVHKLSLYLLDWDETLRSQTIAIYDADTNFLLDSRVFNGFESGHYASWNVKGRVVIVVKGNGASSPAVSGLFFD